MKFLQLLQALAFFGLTIGQTFASKELEALDRQLQALFHDLSFGFGGVNIEQNAAVAQCGLIYSEAIFCMVEKCSNYTYDCPSLQDNPNDVEVTCSGVKESICRQTADETCCLDDCQEKFLTLTKCMYGDGLDTCESPVDCTATVVEGAEEYTTEAPTMPGTDTVPGNGTMANTTMEATESVFEVTREPLFALMDPGDDATTIGAFNMESVLAMGPFGAFEAQQNCPSQWTEFVSCVIRDCPTFAEDCPSVNGQGDMMPVSGNSYMESTCDDLVDDICYAVSDCCLQRCIVPAQRLTSCIHREQSGLQLNLCPVVECGIDSDVVATSKSGSMTEEKEKLSQETSSTSNTMDMNGDEEVLPFISAAASKAFSVLFLGIAAAFFV